MKLFSHLLTFRIVTIFSGLKHFYSLRSNKAYYKKYGIKKTPWQSLSYSSIHKHDTDDLPWLDTPIDVEAIRAAPLFTTFPAHVQQQILQWKEKGFMKLPGFFEKKRIDETVNSITHKLSEKEKQEYFSNRLLNFYKKSGEIELLFKDPFLLQLLSFILGKEIMPYQTINFYKSSSQPAHSDSIHLTTEPLGYLIGVWVALEDIVAGSGELFYYPGSHKMPYILNDGFKPKHNFWKLDLKLHQKYERKIAEVVNEKGLKEEAFLPKKGDVLIWHANLLHGSYPVVNSSLTRKSLIMHYFAKGVLCYHESMEKPAIFHSEKAV